MTTTTAETVTDEQIERYQVRHAHGGAWETYDTYDGACDAVRAVYTNAEIGHDGDVTEGGDRTLCWRSEADAKDDDGARSCAQIVRLLADAAAEAQS